MVPVRWPLPYKYARSSSILPRRRLSVEFTSIPRGRSIVMSTTVASISKAFGAALLIGAMGCAAARPVVQRDDVAITNDVRARFAADANVSPLKVDVDTKAGVVRLTGFVATDGERNSVERIALEAPGVRSVDNNVIFGMGLTPGAPINH